MPLFLALGHVTHDDRPEGAVLGGAVSYAALAARRLGWEAAVLTAAGPDFDAERELPGVRALVTRSAATTRFRNEYLEDGRRRQALLARADDLHFDAVAEPLRSPDVLLLAPVAGELPAGAATAFEAGVVGAAGQGFLREIDADGSVSPRAWRDPARDLANVHALFLSEDDVAGDLAVVRSLLALVPMVALTRGWQGVQLYTRESVSAVPTLPRQELDPTGAGDVFAAAFLVRYHETHDPLEAAAFACCAASCAVEGVGVASLGDRSEVERRLALRERLLEEGEWDE